MSVRLSGLPSRFLVGQGVDFLKICDGNLRNWDLGVGILKICGGDLRNCRLGVGILKICGGVVKNCANWSS